MMTFKSKPPLSLPRVASVRNRVKPVFANRAKPAIPEMSAASEDLYRIGTSDDVPIN